MQFVLDASAVLARLAADEDLPVAATRALETASPVAPSLWVYETINGLEVMRRRGTLDAETMDDALEVLRLLPIELEPPEVDLASSSVLDVARQFGLSMYDAAYLELAKRRRLPLLTLDEGLRRAARKGRVKLV